MGYFIVEPNEAEIRLDIYLKDKLGGGFTRSAVTKLIETNVTVNGKTVKAGYKTRTADTVAVTIPEPTPPITLPENIVLDVVYEDNDIIVVNKPQGLVVHPAAGNYGGTLVNALLYHCKGSLSGINGVTRPGIVHRLDKDTSGLIVAAKNDAAHQALAAQLAERTMERVYLAIAIGNVKDDEGTINKPITRDPKNRLKMAIITGGREAITHYKVLERFNGYTLLEARLVTGRTHQIRVHMASIHRPILGDKTYGPEKQPFGLNSQMLHAARLCFRHPNGSQMQFEAAPPEKFKEILAKLRC